MVASAVERAGDALDDAIAELELQLEQLRRAREVLGGARTAAAAPAPAATKASLAHTGRDRATVTAAYAELAKHAGRLDPKTCRAIKLRGEGKMPKEIATTMRLTVDDITMRLLDGRRKIEKARREAGLFRTIASFSPLTMAPDCTTTIHPSLYCSAAGLARIASRRCSRISRGPMVVGSPARTTGSLVCKVATRSAVASFGCIKYPDDPDGSPSCGAGPPRLITFDVGLAWTLARLGGIDTRLVS